jgi:NitT/TauT family transport system substrate-binding protein
MKLKYLVVTILLLLLVTSSFFIVRRHHEQPPRVVRIGYIPIADCGQLFLANRGEFQRRSLRVELVSMSGGAKILEALASGSIDIGFSNLPSLILARQAGFPLKAITGGPVEDLAHKEHALLVLAKSDLRSVTDLNKKRIAINTRKNIDELRLRQLLEAYNVPFSSVTLTEVPFPQMLATLQSRQVDAIAVIEPFVAASLMSGDTRILAYTYTDVAPRTEVSTYVADERWIKSHPEELSSFAQAIQTVTPEANNDLAALKEALRQNTSLSNEILDRVSFPAFSSSVTEKQLKEYMALIQKAGWANITINPKDIIYR